MLFGRGILRARFVPKSIRRTRSICPGPGCLSIQKLMSKMVKRKLSTTDSPATALVSPSPGRVVRTKRPRHVLYAQFDDGELDERPLMDLLNVKLSTTGHKSVTIRTDDGGSVTQSYAGAFVYFCSRSQVDHVWRSMVVAQFFNRRLGPLVHIRACSKSSKRIREEDLADEEFMRNIEKVGGFGSPLHFDACVVVPVSCGTFANVLFRGSAILSALGLVNEPLYFQQGWMPLEAFSDQDAQRRAAVIKVEKREGESCLYELEGIRWKPINFN